MRRMRGVLAVVGVAVAVGGTVAGCSSSSKSDAQGGGATATGQVSATQTQATQSQSPTVVASPSPTQTASSPAPAQPSAGVSVSAQGVPTSIDPCQLVPQAEASTLAGASFGPGKEETAGLSKRCTYGGQTLNVFTVEAAEATDATAAQAAWDDAQAQVNTELKQQVPAGINLAVANTAVTGIGDKAAEVSGTATIQGQTIGISGIYVLKGAKFFAFQDLKLGTPPSAAAMEAEAQQALGRL